MTDISSKQKRSQIMSRIRSKGSVPEILVRRIIHRLGYRFRLHVKNLLGKPDLVLKRHKLIVLVHGCFWHRCPSCALPLPKSNSEYWRTKFARNVERDKLVISQLTSDGWRVEVVWECRLRGKTADIEEVLDQLGTYWEKC